MYKVVRCSEVRIPYIYSHGVINSYKAYLLVDLSRYADDSVAQCWWVERPFAIHKTNYRFNSFFPIWNSVLLLHSQRLFILASWIKHIAKIDSRARLKPDSLLGPMHIDSIYCIITSASVYANFDRQFDNVLIKHSLWYGVRDSDVWMGIHAVHSKT